MYPQFIDFAILNVPEKDHLADQLRGQNQQHVLVVFHDTDENEELAVFLGKIFAAVQIDLHKDTILLKLTSFERFSFAGLRQMQDIQTVILFGIHPEQLGVQFVTPPYHPIRHENITFLFADDLQAIFAERQAGGKQMSGALWKALKDLFQK